jgi:putative acetyltransferase
VYTERATQADYPRLIELWEASVRATHDFLAEQDLVELKPLILEQYFAAVELTVAKDTDAQILGFIGVSEGNIEMLFIAPESRGLGVGKLLTCYAINCQQATRVDVNEQNEQALGFYQHLGFSVIGRSPQDGQGKPYPLLHMELTAV